MKKTSPIIGLRDATECDILALKKKYPNGLHKTLDSSGNKLPFNGIFIPNYTKCTKMNEFREELKALLEKHRVALIARSLKDEEDYSVEIGFQYAGENFRNEWTNRHHVTGYELTFLPKVELNNSSLEGIKND